MKSINNFIKNNIKIISTIIFSILLLFLGYTLAASSNISVNITTGNYNVVYTGSTTLPSSKLEPVLDSEITFDTTNNKVLKATFTVKGANNNPSNIPIIYDVSLTDLNMDEQTHHKLLKWKLFKNNVAISNGNFSYEFDSQTNNRMVLTEIQQDLPSYSNNADSYTLIIWISEACTGNVATCTIDQDVSGLINKTISGNIKIELSTKSKKNLVRKNGKQPNSPSLVEGLIPVVYNETNSTWVKADASNANSSWYDYNDKKWANAVLVSSTNRSTYNSATSGTTIADDDILAFYVWIPRFKYKVWNINKNTGTDSYNAENTGIDIMFENNTETTGTISCTYDFDVGGSSTNAESCTGTNDSYYTHPAFTFGSTELRGFWIGKFELSSATPAATNGGGVSTTLTPRVLPNVTSWRYNFVSNFWKVIFNMQSTNNIYGLSTSRTNTDSHMITDMEWGAVAYLTHSKYGRCTDGTCTEVTNNNCNTFITGIGGNTVSDSASEATCTTATNKYNGSTGILASTTGNITGVYDMSGGASEYTMGNASSSASQFTYNASNAGTNFTYSAATNKYLTTYAYFPDNYGNSNHNDQLGDARCELIASSSNNFFAWNNDFSRPATSNFPWTLRGGNAAGIQRVQNGAQPISLNGIFSLNSYDGSPSIYLSTRPVLAYVG